MNETQPPPGPDPAPETPPALAEFQRLLKDLPQGLGGGIELLLGELSPEGAEALRLAAIPHQFDRALLAVLKPGLSSPALDLVFDELADLSIVIPSDAGFAIHDEGRAYLFGEWLTPERRDAFADISARLAAHFAALETEGAGEIRTIAQRARIFHLIGADQAAGFAAFEALCRQERMEFRLHACEALIRLAHEYDAVLAAPRRLRLRFLEARLLLDLRRYPEAEALLTELRDACRDESRLWARVTFRLGRLRQAQRRYDDALSLYTEALAYVRSHDELRDEELRLLQSLAALHAMRDELDEAGALLATAVAKAEALGDRGELAACHNSLGILLRRQSEPDRAIAAFQASLDCFGGGRDGFRAAQVHSNLGLAYADQADWERARESLEHALEISRRADDANGQATALINLMRPYLGLQRRADAIAAGERAIGLFVRIHNWHDAAKTAESFSRLYRRERRLAEARAALVQAADLYRRAGDPARAAGCDELGRRIDRKRRMPWYVTILLVVFGLGIVVAVIGAIFA